MTSITYLGIASLLLLVIPTLIINLRLNININRALIISLIRMVIQLSLVGIYLQYIFDLNSTLLNISYIIVMMGVATFSIIHSTSLRLKHLFLPIFTSMLIPNLIILIYFNSFVIRLDHIFEARYMITIGGMLLGNVLSGDIIGLQTFYQGIKDQKDRVYYDFALGATRFQAIKPYLKRAISASVKPTIASMATIGLVALPGMMTGQILGGSVPLHAIMYQMAIMIAIFVTRYFNILLSILFSLPLVFDERDCLKSDIFK